jgi:hypothetical protein
MRAARSAWFCIADPCRNAEAALRRPLGPCDRLGPMILTGSCFHSSKRFLPFILLAASGSLLHASTIQTISIDLAALHAGSVLSGSVILQNPLMLGDSVQIPLSFTDPSDYSPTSLTTTLSVTNGTPNDQFRFDTISFLNLANSKTYNLVVRGAASCAVDFPCQATGGYEANSPPAFSGTYTITAAAAPASVPEPSYTLLVSGFLATFAFGRRLFGCKRSA